MLLLVILIYLAACSLLDPVVEVGVAPLLEDIAMALLKLELAYVRLVDPRAVLEVGVGDA